MKGRIQIQETKTANIQNIRTTGKQKSAPADLIKFKRISEILTSESNESFKHYIEWLGLSTDRKLVVLSSIHHYYYEHHNNHLFELVCHN